MATVQNEKDVRAAFIGVSQEVQKQTKSFLEKISQEVEKNLKAQYEVMRKAVSSAVKVAAVSDHPPTWSKESLKLAAAKLSDNASTLYHKNQSARIQKTTEILKDAGILDQPAHKGPRK